MKLFGKQVFIFFFINYLYLIAFNALLYFIVNPKTGKIQKTKLMNFFIF